MHKSDEDKKRRMKKIQYDINMERIWEKKRDTWKQRVNETVGNLRMEKQKKIEKRIFKQVMRIKKREYSNSMRNKYGKDL